MNYKKIFIASDHAGLPLKESLLKNKIDLPWEDLGTHTEQSVDYPDFAGLLCDHLSKSDSSSVCGVLICGSGQGMAMAANRNSNIRAALCWTPEIAKLSRAHNDANVLCMGSRFIESKIAMEILETFLITEFEGGRHAKRVAKLSKS